MTTARPQPVLPRRPPPAESNDNVAPPARPTFTLGPTQEPRPAALADVRPDHADIPEPADREAANGSAEAPAAKMAEEPLKTRDVRSDWQDFIAFLKNEKEWMAQSLQQTVSVKKRDNELILEFDDPNDCFVLRTKEHRQILTEYVLDFFQQDLSIRIVSPDNSNGLGAQNIDEPKRRRKQLASHQIVRMTEEIFNGRVGAIRISDPNK